MSKRTEFLDRVLLEREHQLDRFGSEWDRTNTPNDWCAIVGKYLFQLASNANHAVPLDADEFAEIITKSSAILLAAYEHLDMMSERGLLK
jgi:hypothetical protein